MAMGEGELRALVERSRPEGRGEGYPAGVRAAVVRWARERRRAGATWTELGAGVGLSATTVQNWVRAADSLRTASPRAAEEPAAGFLAVAEVEELAADAVAAPLVLHLPGGARVTGLGVGDVVALVRALR